MVLWQKTTNEEVDGIMERILDGMMEKLLDGMMEKSFDGILEQTYDGKTTSAGLGTICMRVVYLQ